MALLLMMALLSFTGTLVYSAGNKTNCDLEAHMDYNCTQLACDPQSSPCNMLCGLTKQYDACSQVCLRTVCDALICNASDVCHQSCPWPSHCESMTCDTKECSQFCSRGECNTMTCPKTVHNCRQFQAREMTCEADVCDQTCDDGECQMTCPIGRSKCEQSSVIGAKSATMDCDRGACNQVCIMGRCNMSCSSSVTTGRCDQICSFSARCESMVCNTTNCSQSSLNSDCSMTCPFGVKSCTQEAYNKNVGMFCDGEVCKQDCQGHASCNMTCSANVKECHQICSSGKCVYKCDAEKCKVEGCFDGSPCTTVKPTSSVGTNVSSTTNVTTKSITVKGSATAPLQMRSLIFWALNLAFIVYM